MLNLVLSINNSKSFYCEDLFGSLFLKCGTFAGNVKLVIITATVLNALSLRQDIQNVCLTYAYSFDVLYYLT